MKKLYYSAIAFLALQFLQAQTTITEWNFDANNTTPITGTGTITNIGGTTSSYAGGNPSTGRGYNTTTYPAQGTASGTAGIEIAVSTVGQTNIGITADHRSSGTNSRFAQYEYSTDGTTWIVAGNNNGALSPHDAFTAVEVDLTSCTACNNNANFKFRIVSIFSPTAFNQNETLSYVANEAYMRSNAAAKFTPDAGVGTGNYGTSGTWRFDNIKVIGNFVLSNNDFENAKSIKMYPNPSNDFVNFSENVAVKIFDVVGKLVFENEKTQQIDVANFNKGIYFVNINNSETKKLIVE